MTISIFHSKIGTNGSGIDQFYNPMSITLDGTYLYVADRVNNRIVKRLMSDLSYVSQKSLSGAANNIYFLTNDGTYLYLGSQFAPTNIQKRNLSDMNLVTQIGTFGSGNDQFNTPKTCEMIGSNLYVSDSGNARIMRRLLSDLSFVDKTSGAGADAFSYPSGIANDGTYLYIADVFNYRIQKRLISDYSYISSYEPGQGSAPGQFEDVEGVAYYDGYLYAIDRVNSRITKIQVSDMSFVEDEGSIGTGDDSYIDPYDIKTDGTYFYIADTGNDRIIKRTIFSAPIPPDAPVLTSVTPGTFSNTLTWTHAGGPAIQYNIYWDTSPGVIIGDNPIYNVASPYVHSLLSTIPYYYVVTAYDTDDDLESIESNEMSATPNRLPPSQGRVIW